MKLVSDKIDEAVKAFNKAGPRNASTFSDLSAAYLAAGEQRDRHDLRPYILAASAADQAVQIDGELPEAWFNRALALQALGLQGEARVSWQRYLELDKKSLWSLEAKEEVKYLDWQSEKRTQYSWEKNRIALAEAAKRGNMKELAELVLLHPEILQLRTVTSLLGAWAELWKSGSIDEAKANLETAGLVGTYFYNKHHDDILVEAVERVRQASLGQDEAEMDLVADAYYTLWKAMEVYFSSGACQAYSLLSKAGGKLQEIKSPLVRVAFLHMAVCEYLRGNYLVAQDRLKKNCSGASGLQSPLLMSKCWWMRGMCSLRAADPVGSIQSYNKALGYSSDLRMFEDSGAVHHLLAESYRYLGQEDQAWMHRKSALDFTLRSENYRRVYAVLDELANAIADFGYPNVELLFRNEVVRLGLQGADEEGESFALIRRAETFARLGNKKRSKLDLDKAEKIAMLIQEPNVRSDQELRRAITYSLWDYDDHHLAILTEGLARCRLQGDNYLVSRILLARARINLAQHRIGEARQDLMDIADLYESRRSVLSEERFRASYFGQAQEIFGKLIAIELSQGSYSKAFGLSEQARSRILLDRLLPGLLRLDKDERPVDPSFLLSRIPKGRTLVEYISLDDALGIWVLRHGSLKFFEVLVSRRELDKEVNGFQDALLRGHQSTRTRAERLFELLVQPFSELLREGDTLVVLPDSLLVNVPFAALINRSSGRYLIESNPMVYAPSAGFYVEARSRAEGLDPLGTVLVVGNPETGGRIPHLPNLPGAERESALVGSIYPRAVSLTGSAATDLAFIQAAESASLVHIATHALISPINPEMSALLFAPGSQTDGVIYARELLPGMFRKTRLIVLASCRTGYGETETGKGSIGLTGAFLGAGVPMVLGSLWNLDDEESLRLMVGFHEALRHGFAPAEAIRQSQVRFLSENPGSERLWAGLRLVGGG